MVEPREVSVLQRKAEEFLQIFRKGEEFTQELLKENERLRFRVAQLEEGDLASRRTDELTVKNLRERIALLEEERDRFLARFKEVEEENKVFASKYLEVEEENNNLANLYVASYQLHSTLDFEEVLRVVQEIVINLVGAEKFVLYLRNERTDELAPAAAEGLNMADAAPVLVGSGIVGRVGETGESFYQESIPTFQGVDFERPLTAIPLKINDLVIGVLAVYKLLVQKPGFSPIDYELFSMLAGHAATAIFSSKLYSQSARKLSTIRGFLDLLRERPAE
ncbi:MAG: GAF domain-containing protein [Nitrospirae bacterium]|nr:GAF domain-containing protein [Nitrospirota bacterium]MBI3391625.1 GAF domain-containing protein [Nitrospirota bacterium]